MILLDQRPAYAVQRRGVTTWEYDGDDFCCDAARPRAQDLGAVAEDALVLALRHTRPYWPVHVVVVPERHLTSLTTVGVQDEADLRALLATVQRVARQVEEVHGPATVPTNLGR